MKAAVISDLHYDINADYDIDSALSRVAHANDAKLFILAGDITCHADTTIEAVARLEQKSGIPVVYVPGNHDLWDREGKTTPETDRLYEKMVSDPHCLCEFPRLFGEHYLVGDVGWYDYSFGNPAFSKEDFDRMTLGERVWQDSLRNVWTADNLAAHQRFLERIEAGLQSVPDGKKAVVVTHMLPHTAFTVPEEREIWKYFNAFLGSKALGALFSRYPVSHSICGHVHYRACFDEAAIHWSCRCLNYHTEWRAQEGGADVFAQVADAVEFLSL